MSQIEREFQEKMTEMEGLVYDIQGARIECFHLAKTVAELTKQVTLLKEKVKEQELEKTELEKEAKASVDLRAVARSVSKSFNTESEVQPKESNSKDEFKHKLRECLPKEVNHTLVRNENNLTNALGDNFIKPRTKVPKSWSTRKRCSVCYRTFTTVQTLMVHKNLHSGRRPFSCQLCNLKCSNVATLKNHVKGHAIVDFQKVCHDKNHLFNT